jgi:hypothetical protein
MNQAQLDFVREWDGPADELYFIELDRLDTGDDEGGEDVADIGAVPVRDEPPPLPLGAALARVERLIRRYVILARDDAYVAVTLWVAHTHAIEVADATPYLAIVSPEKQSGKTRLLEVLHPLVHACDGPIITPTASTIYRSLDAAPGATLLLDELDAIFKDRGDRYEETRGVINAGHRRGATVPRNVPGPKNTWTVKRFPVFGPKALAGIGKLPDTIADRSIPIRMVRRKASEPVEKFRLRTGGEAARATAAALRASLGATPIATTAELPLGLTDRQEDGWEPLIAIAVAAGGDWPARARAAALVLQPSSEQSESLGLRLLADIREVYRSHGVERIAAADLIASLKANDEGPWASERYPLTPHKLARHLAPYEISSKQMRIGERNVKGYERSWFVDTWDRFLGAPPPPAETKHRNTEQSRRFDVSDDVPPEGEAVREWMEAPIEEDYPQSAWDPDYLGEPTEAIVA